MGQLEKYGLYVLCLVIFLILGVTIWGGGDMPPGKSPTASIHAPNNGAAANARTNGPNGQRLPALAELLEASDSGRGGASPPASGGNGSGNGSGGTPNGGAKEGSKSEPKSDAKVAPKTEPREATLAVYKVQDGDTFDSIARTKLGKPVPVDDLMRLNPSVDPRKMRPGTELKLPGAAAVADADARTKSLDKPISPASDGSRTYLVKKGDNFERIAKAELGSAKRLQELQQLNAGVDPLKLRPGMSLKLPPK